MRFLVMIFAIMLCGCFDPETVVDDAKDVATVVKLPACKKLVSAERKSEMWNVLYRDARPGETSEKYTMDRFSGSSHCSSIEIVETIEDCGGEEELDYSFE